MNGQHRVNPVVDFWHALLLLVFSAGVSAGFGSAAQTFLPSESVPFSGFLGGAAFGAVFCLFVFLRTHRENASKTKRTGPAVPFPRFVLNLFRYGLVVAAAVTLGFLTWTGLEEIAFGRPLTEAIEIVLGLVASCGVGFAAFFQLIRLLERD